MTAVATRDCTDLWACTFSRVGACRHACVAPRGFVSPYGRSGTKALKLGPSETLRATNTSSRRKRRGTK